jgi:hypothetical protein
MNSIMKSAVAALSLLASVPAHATTLLASGTISRIAALQDSQYVAVPAGTLKVGDRFSLSATFDLTQAQLSATFDADPTVNIYDLPGTAVTLTIGTWTTSFTPSPIGASTQIWNDHVVVNPADSQSYRFFRFRPPASEVPFDLGPGDLSYSVNQMNFDNSATARSNDLVTQVAPLSAFNSHLFSVGFLNASSGLFALADGRIERAELVESAVPEPSTWTLLILGFGFVGWALRRPRTRPLRRLRCAPILQTVRQG